MDKKNHWEDVYEKKKIDEVSWYQTRPEVSLRMIREVRLPLDAPIIDVGGGASTLVDHLVDLGFKDLTVLDLSGKALERARQRLGDKAEDIRWIEADILEFNPKQTYAFWHDRAVFHFLMDQEDKRKYLHALDRALQPSAYAMIATFALDGPEKCSGLPVCRYSFESLHQALGFGYQLVLKDEERHKTPAGREQSFIYSLFRKG